MCNVTFALKVVLNKMQCQLGKLNTTFFRRFDSAGGIVAGLMFAIHTEFDQNTRLLFKGKGKGKRKGKGKQ